MQIKNLNNLKLNKLTQAQYDKELAAGTLNPDEIYLTPEEELDLSGYATVKQLEDKADSLHTHDDRYYTETEIDERVATLNSAIAEKAEGDHKHSQLAGDTCNVQLTSFNLSADSPITLGSSDHPWENIYASSITLSSEGDIVDYIDREINGHNTSTTAHSDIHLLISNLTTRLNALADSDDTTLDQLSEIVEYIKANRTLIESVTTNKLNVSDVVDNLTTNVSNKALSAKQGVAIKALIDALEGELDGHTHAISEVTGLQSALDGKAATSHGTHVSYSTTVPVMDGTASAGSASTVARSDHKHPVDTSRASKTDFDSHVSNTTSHITSTERTNWNAAKTHADSAHAPSNAEKNQNAFSNIVVGSTTVAADSATDTLTLAGSNVTITPDATNDKVTIGITKTDVTSALGYTPPTTNTTYSAGTGLSLSGTTFSNSGVHSIATGSTNGTISVNTNGTTTNVAVKGLGSAAYTDSSDYVNDEVLNTTAKQVWMSAKTLMINASASGISDVGQLTDLVIDKTFQDISAIYARNLPSDEIPLGVSDISMRISLPLGGNIRTIALNTMFVVPGKTGDSVDGFYFHGSFPAYLTGGPCDEVLVEITSSGVTGAILDAGYQKLHNTVYDATSSDGVNYAVVIPYCRLRDNTATGDTFVIQPDKTSATTTPMLSVNGSKAAYIRRRLSTQTGTTVVGSTTDWITANNPIRVTYDGTYWIVDDLIQSSASDLYGTVAIDKGGTGATSASAALVNLGAMPDVPVTTADAGKFLRVSSDGVWVAESIPNAEDQTY